MAQTETQAKTKARILVAAPLNSADVIIEALSNRFELSFLSSMKHAISYSYVDTDVIICCMYFDESSMFDLLKFAKSNSTAHKIPFICINTVDGALNKISEQGIAIACKTLGAVDFFDLCHWRDKLGSTEAKVKLQALVDQLVKQCVS